MSDQRFIHHNMNWELLRPDVDGPQWWPGSMIMGRYSAAGWLKLKSCGLNPLYGVDRSGLQINVISHSTLPLYEYWPGSENSSPSSIDPATVVSNRERAGDEYPD